MYSPSGDQSPGYEAAPDYEDLQNNLDTVMPPGAPPLLRSGQGVSAAKHLLHYQQRAQSVREILRHKKRASE